MAGNTIGVDVGGTKIYAVLVDESGSIAARAKTPSPTNTPEALMEAVAKCIRTVAAKAHLDPTEVDGIGIGVPGVVSADGVCVWAPNCPLTGVDVAGILQAEFGVPVAVGNDVNVGTLGEKAFGSGRGYDDVFGMFVGTGIGGGLVVRGQIVVGDHCLGAEVGHIIIDANAALAGDEGGGEFEYYAGRLGIERMIRAAIAEGRETIVADRLGEGNDRIKSGLLKEGVEAGDAVVIEALERASALIGLASVTVIHLCDPQAIIYGGGVIEACADFMMPRIEAAIRAHVAPGNGQPLRLLVSELGDDAVALGAAALASGTVDSGHRTEDEGYGEPANLYPAVAAAEFGRVVVNGQVVERDLVVRANGKVKKRKKDLSRDVHGTAHEISVEEVKYVCRQIPQTFVLGSGYEGLLTLSRDAMRWLQKRGVQAIVLPTPQAADAFTAASGTKSLLLHIGC